MDRIGNLVLNIAVALYLLANGILGLGKKGAFQKKAAFQEMAETIFKGDTANLVAIILSVVALIAGVLLLLQLFKIAVPRVELLMIIIIIVWVVFIVIVDIINPIQGKIDILPYLLQLSAHLMVLGALLSARQSN